MQQLLRIPEAAHALGLKIGTIRAWVLRRKIGYVLVGSRAIRIPTSEVNRVIAEGTIPAREDRQ
jgi:excisionase family DNA binding protein